MSKVYAVSVNVVIDGEAKVLTVFTRAESKTDAIKRTVTIRKATVEDFMPANVPVPQPVVPSSTPEPSNE